MNQSSPSLHNLRALIGTQALLQGKRYRIIEIIEEPLSIVLESERQTIQSDVHGNARRQARQILTVAVFDQDRNLSETFQALIPIQSNFQPSKTLDKDAQTRII